MLRSLLILLCGVCLQSSVLALKASSRIPIQPEKAAFCHLGLEKHCGRKSMNIGGSYSHTLPRHPTPTDQNNPRKLAWAVLSMTTYTEDRLTEKYIPEFPQVLKDRFAGEKVIITGYLIPIDVEDHRYALSKNPFSSCFFCGQAGPETVIELKFSEDPGRFATDRYLPVEGTLRLNRHGGDLFFTILNARIAG